MRFHLPFPVALLFLTIGMPTLRAGTWEDANAAFAAGAYGKALPLYEDLIDREGPTAARLFNLGNTHAKHNQPGLAVLCYERAALLAPRDADIQANLKLIRPANATLLQPPPPLWKAPLYWLSLNEWSWLTALGLALCSTLILMRQWLFPYLSGRAAPAKALWSAGGLPPLSPARLAPRGTGQDIKPAPEPRGKTAASSLRESGGKPPAIQTLQRAAGPLIGAGLALAMLGGFALQQRHGEKDLAIITASEPVLRLSPFPTADPVDSSPPLPGQRVIPGARHGDWVHLSLPGGLPAGWIPERDTVLIIPAT